MTRVYLEYCGQTWTKFWTAHAEGNELVTVYGKRGGTAHESRIDLRSPAAAIAAVEREATRKRRKGYVDAPKGKATWDELHALQALTECFANVPGPRTCVQLLQTRTDMPVLGKSRVGGAAPKSVVVPESDAFLRFLGNRAETTDTRQAHVMTIATEELAVAGVPVGSALCFFTPVFEWLSEHRPIEVVVADLNADLSPQDMELPPIPPGYARHRPARGLRISKPVHVPSLAFSMRAYDFEDYERTYELETEALRAATEQRTAILRSGKYAEVFYWAGKRKKLTQTQFEAIDRIQLLLMATGYVGGCPLRTQGALTPEFDKFHCQFGESFGVHVKGGAAYVGLNTSSWEPRN